MEIDQKIKGGDDRMFTYLIIFGMGAITFVIEKKLAGIHQENGVFLFIEYLMYTVIDLVTTYFMLEPTGRITMVQSGGGMNEINYGSSAILISLVIAVIWGCVMAFLNKNVKCKITVDERKKK